MRFLSQVSIAIISGWIARDIFSHQAARFACDPTLRCVCTDAELLGSIWAATIPCIVFGLTIYLPYEHVYFKRVASSGIGEQEVTLSDSTFVWSIFLALCCWAALLSTFQLIG